MDKKSSAETSLPDRPPGRAIEPKIEVDVQIAEAFVRLLSEERLRAVAQAVLHHEEVYGQATIVVTDDLGIRGLNRDFLGIDAPTDVLAFSAQEEVEDFVIAPGEEEYLGDVIVSYPSAVAQAGKAGHSVDKEMTLLIVHGLLHLLGYDHAGEEEQAVMWARQETLMSRLTA